MLTLVRGRQSHFDHLIAGLRAQVAFPEELIVAHMQDEPPAVPKDMPFAVRMVHVPGERLPLAKARNAAAQLASGEVLALLDVDCIPGPHFVRRASEVVAETEMGVFLPEVGYLPARREGWMNSATGMPDFGLIARSSQRHPAKPDLAGVSVARISGHRELWGLAFILHRQTWASVGGMDEHYIGYGGEETDFAQRLKQAGSGLFWLGGTVCYHQHHRVHVPPLQHFDAILENARRYRRKWGDWCMTYWLDQFEEMGLVTRNSIALTKVRAPTEDEIAQSLQGDDVRFS
ncbi:glycosyltransferase [Altererythrobacter sediminis]|uniref:Glycosyltransferase n=1 Tax=Allopontixanthobacter sediminis TaxID=1689985 RepID=A0A845ATM5_9SPHN|nr:glycosyltransferase [Allopontixanthobacter sediminis]